MKHTIFIRKSVYETKILNREQNKEIISAAKYVIRQINKGWSVEEAFHQMRNAYGDFIATFTEYYFSRNISKNK